MGTALIISPYAIGKADGTLLPSPLAAEGGEVAPRHCEERTDPALADPMTDFATKQSRAAFQNWIASLPLAMTPYKIVRIGTFAGPRVLLWKTGNRASGKI